MKQIRLFLLLVVVGALFVPAVSAEMLSDVDSETISFTTTPTNYYNIYHLRVNNIADCRGLYFVYAVVTPTADWGVTVLTANPYYESAVTLKVGSNTVGHGTAYYNALYTNNVVTKAQIWMEIDDFDPQLMTGAKEISIIPASGSLFNEFQSRYDATSPGSIDKPIGFGMNTGATKGLVAGSHIVKKHFEWYNEINIDDDEISLTRNVNGVGYWSNLTVEYNGVVVRDTNINDISIPYIGVVNWTVINGNNRMYTGSYGSAIEDGAESSELKLYVQNSQTGALIAGPRAVISAGFYDPAELIEVSNTTLSGGTKTYTLQPTGGGLPNPDYYRVSVTADGYNAEMPYADITLDAGMSMTMVMGMEPTAGAPEDPGYTYIDVYVRDIYANPIADVTVKMGQYTLKTNSAGYTLFDMPVNSTYTYTVKKTGYTSVEGTVTVANAPRYPVNIVMGTGVIPTNTPTAEPTVPGATPTVPAGEETPGPGFVDQSANNFATFLGVSYAVGRAALGMLIATAIGFTTARKLKGGAPEFGIGFIAGAALMVLITLLPAWIFIVMVIIIGGLLGYKYMSGGS